jgi:hypothetical protein
LVVSGLLNKQAAARLGISAITLQIHRTNVMGKMAADSRADLVRMAGSVQIPLADEQIELWRLPAARDRRLLRLS